MFGLEHLPETLPVFPLTGVILLPRGHLPLNIFESRYLDMVYYAREKNGLMGMIQPAMTDRHSGKGNDRLGTAPRNRPLCTTGCVGMISDLRENERGDLVLSLTGLSRYDIVEELPQSRSFREMRVCYDRFAGDCAAPPAAGRILRQQLIGRVEKYLKLDNIMADWPSLDKACDEELVNGLAMACPFDTTEKQALLETITLTDRIDLMLRMIEFDLSGGRHLAPENTIQ